MGQHVKKLEYNGRKNICGDMVRRERLARRLSQARLAAKMQILGVTIEQDAISRIEAGERLVTDYELRAFASIFCLPVEELFAPEEF